MPLTSWSLIFLINKIRADNRIPKIPSSMACYECISVSSGRQRREVKLIVNRGLLRLEGEDSSAGEDEMEKGSGGHPKARGDSAEKPSPVLPGASPQFAFVDQLLQGLQALPRVPEKSGFPCSPHLLSSRKDTISRDMKPKGL